MRRFANSVGADSNKLTVRGTLHKGVAKSATASSANAPIWFAFSGAPSFLSMLLLSIVVLLRALSSLAGHHCPFAAPRKFNFVLQCKCNQCQQLIFESQSYSIQPERNIPNPEGCCLRSGHDADVAWCKAHNIEQSDVASTPWHK